jgi:hypothetical protein
MQTAAGKGLSALCGVWMLCVSQSYGAHALPAIQPDAADVAMLAGIEHRTFNYFWATANPANGLVPDRYPTPAPSSIAAVGFALTAYPIGVERGYITRERALQRVRNTLAFFHDAPQGPQRHGKAGFHGFFYHFLDMQTGRRYRHCELSTIDTALLIAGVLVVENYFDRPDPAEVEVRRLADDLYRGVDWAWSTHADGGVTMGWTPEHGAMAGNWHGYNEGILIYLLGLGSPTHPLTDASWRVWTSTYAQNWRSEYGQTYLAYPTLFVHQFMAVWVDPRGIRDAFMREKGIDYFENTRRATYANRAYAIANPLRWAGYSERLWGLTASDGPGGGWQLFRGQRRRFLGYAARGIKYFDDGTLAPNGPIGSIAFAPEIVMPAIAELRRRYGNYLYSTYGFLDAFNPSVEFSPATGTVVKGLGWFNVDYIGIDQGLIVTMLENYRSGLVWQLMRTDSYLRRGLERAGFTGGWLEAQP